MGNPEYLLIKIQDACRYDDERWLLHVHHRRSVLR